MRLNNFRLELSIKKKPYATPLLITVFLFGRFLPKGFKSWAINHALSPKVSVPTGQTNQ